MRSRRVALRRIARIAGRSAVHRHSLTVSARAGVVQGACIITSVGVVIDEHASGHRIAGIIGTRILVVADQRCPFKTLPGAASFHSIAGISIVTRVGVVAHKDTSSQRITGIIGTLISIVAGVVIGHVDAAAGLFAGIDRAGEAILAVLRNARARSVCTLVLNRAVQAVVAGSGNVDVLTYTLYANSIRAHVAVIATIDGSKAFDTNVGGFVARACALVAAADAIAANAMIVDRTKEPVFAVIGIGELAALTTDACIVGACVVVLAVSISHALHAGISIFIAVKIRRYGASISGACAIAAYAETAFRAVQPIVTRFGVVVGEDTSARWITGIIGTQIPVVTEGGRSAHAVRIGANVIVRTGVSVITRPGVGFVPASSLRYTAIRGANVGVVAIERGATADSLAATVVDRAGVVVVAENGVVDLHTALARTGIVRTDIPVIALHGGSRFADAGDALFFTVA